MPLQLTGFDGFDLYPQTGADFPSGQAVRFAGDGVTGGASGFTFTSSAARTPGQGIQSLSSNAVNGLENANAGLLYPLSNPTARNTRLMCGASVKINGLDEHALFSLAQADGRLQYGLTVGSSGFLQVTARSSSATSVVTTAATPLPIGEWAFVEWYIEVLPEPGDLDDIIIGRTIIRINGVIEADFVDVVPTGRTIGGAVSPASDLAVGVSPFTSTSTRQGGTYCIDNFYYGEVTGITPEQDFLGERAVFIRRGDAVDPSSTGFTQFGSLNTLDTFTSFDGDASGYRGENPGDVLVLSSQDVFPQNIGTIDAVVVVFSASKDGAGSRDVAPFLRIGGTDFTSPSISLGEGFGTRVSNLYEVNPDGGTAWDQASVEGLQYGLEIV